MATTKSDYNEISFVLDSIVPARKHIISHAEADAVREALELSTRNRIELSNVRDMLVMLCNIQMDDARAAGDMARFDKLLDQMSAFTFVIDDEFLRRQK